jgi:nucleotide-binding universal stress UspA family protein
MRYRKILHPTDYSDDSKPALRMAADLAGQHGATLVLLHVVETLGPERVSFGEVGKRQPEAFRRRLWDEIHHARPADPQLHVEYVLSEEDVVTAILRTAVDLECDLIVMGTHGVTGWRWLTPSIAEEVVRRATCAVLVVKPPVVSRPLPTYSATEAHPGRLVQGEPSDPS